MIRTLQVEDERTITALTITPPAEPNPGPLARITITHANLLAAMAAGTLVLDQEYLVVARPTTAEGQAGNLLVRAVSTRELSTDVTLLAPVPDYANVNTWNADSAPRPAYTPVSAPYQPELPSGLPGGEVESVYGDDSVYSRPLPFAFPFAGQTYSTVTLDTNGRVLLGDATTNPEFAGQYRSLYVPDNSNPRVPTIAGLWCDLDVRGVSAALNIFTVGEAPNRRQVFEWKNVSRYHETLIVTFQVVLAENGDFRFGWGNPTFPNADVTPGVFYTRNGDVVVSPPYPAGTPALPDLQYVYNGVDIPGQPFGDSTCIWSQKTWNLAPGGNSSAEPGTTADWVSVPNPATQPDAAKYYAVGDLLLERRDRYGNVVRGTALNFFPFGNPRLTNNTVNGLTAPTSLLNIAPLSNLQSVGLTTAVTKSNTFVVGSSLKPMDLQVVKLVFTDGTFMTTAPATPVQTTGTSTTLVMSQDGTTKAVNAVDAKVVAQIVAYRNASPTVYLGPNALAVGNSDTTEHDVLEIRGFFTQLYLINRDYNIRGFNAYAATVWTGPNGGSKPLTVTAQGISAGTWFVQESFYDNTAKGHLITVERCGIAQVNIYQSNSGGARDRHTFSYCTIGQVYQAAAYLGTPGHTLVFNKCQLGGRDNGYLIDASFNAGTMSCAFRDSTFVLKGTGDVFRPGNVHPYLAFTNCTVVRANGTSYRLDTTSDVVATDPGYTDEQARDAVAAMLAAGTHTGITFSYADGADTLSASVTALAAQATPLTYAQLTAALAGAGTLVPSGWYLLTDYRTEHTIPYTTALNTGPVEPLLLQASAPNQLAAQGFSTVYPADEIYYTPVNDQSRLPGCTHGYVYRRLDHVWNNDICYDFRAVKFRRWKDAGGTYTQATTDGTGPNAVPNTADFQDLPTFDLVTYNQGKYLDQHWLLTPKYNPFQYNYNVVCVQAAMYNCYLTNGALKNVTLMPGAYIEGLTAESAGGANNLILEGNSQWYMGRVTHDGGVSGRLSNNSYLGYLDIYGGGLTATLSGASVDHVTLHESVIIATLGDYQEVYKTELRQSRLLNVTASIENCSFENVFQTTTNPIAFALANSKFRNSLSGFPVTAPISNARYFNGALEASGGGGPTVVQALGSSTADVLSQNAVTVNLALKYDKPTGTSVVLGNGAVGVGGYTVTIGSNAGGGTTGGFGGVFVGTGAGYKSNAAGGIFMGQNAALNHVSGDDNLFIGRYVANNFTTGGRNIAFGYMAGPKTALSNTVAIGNNVTPTAANVLLLGGGTGDVYNVGIATDGAPTEKLQVGGIIWSTTGGIKFPDGSVQITAATGSGSTTGGITSAALALSGQTLTLNTSNGSSSVTLPAATGGGPTYSAGPGIDLAGNVITNTAPGTTYAAGTGIAIAGSTITNTAPGIAYTAGANISISNNVISATGGGTTYAAGTGIAIAGNTISNTGLTSLYLSDNDGASFTLTTNQGNVSVDFTDFTPQYIYQTTGTNPGILMSQKATTDALNTKLSSAVLSLSGTTLTLTTNLGSGSVTLPSGGGGTTYSAGTGISLAGNVITNTAPGTTYAAGSGIAISGNTISNTAPGIAYTAGANVTISGNVISATGGSGGTTYSAGTGIAISGSTISNTAPGIAYTAGTGIAINGTTISATGGSGGTAVVDSLATAYADRAPSVNAVNAALVFKPGAGAQSVLGPGNSNAAGGGNSAVFSGTNNRALGSLSSITGGYNNLVSGYNCHAYGCTDCTIDGDSVAVVLVNCSSLLIEGGDQATYVNNVLVTGSGPSYTAGSGIAISGTTISNTAPGIAYSAGANISIAGNTITNTAPGIAYSAGSGISISGNTITNTAQGFGYTAGAGIAINGTVITATGGGPTTATLDFYYPYGYSDNLRFDAATPTYAQTYNGVTKGNVSDAHYYRNNTEVYLPFTLNTGDSLEVIITRTIVGQAASVSLRT